MPAQPLFSILIPVARRSDFIASAIRSALNQSVQNFEIIIAHCNQDGAIQKIADSFNDKRIRCFLTPDLDPSVGWDFAYKQSNGKYVIWLDDDAVLLPKALSLFAGEAERSGADILTGHILYYRSATHPDDKTRNSLIVLPFTNQRAEVEPRYALECFYDSRKLDPIGNGFHSCALMASRGAVDAAVQKLGFAVLPRHPVNHSMQPIVLAFAKSITVIDTPVAIVGNYAVSLSQQGFLSNLPKGFKFTHSPVSGRTWGNAIVEGYLEVRSLLPEKFLGIDFNYQKFFMGYAHDIAFLRSSLRQMARDFRELIVAMRNYDQEFYRAARWHIRRFIALGMLVRLAKALKIYNALKRLKARSSAGKTAGKEIINLDGYGVKDIDGLLAEFHRVAQDHHIALE